MKYHSLIKKKWSTNTYYNMDGSGIILLSERSQEQKNTFLSGKKNEEVTHDWCFFGEWYIFNNCGHIDSLVLKVVKIWTLTPFLLQCWVWTQGCVHGKQQALLLSYNLSLKVNCWFIYLFSGWYGGHGLTRKPRLALSLLSSCLSIMNVGIIGIATISGYAV